MNALAWILATSAAATGVDYGWQQTRDGEAEYVIQIEPSLIDALLAGEEITSEIPPELAGVRRFRIRVGSGPVPRTPLAASTLPDTRPPDGGMSTPRGTPYPREGLLGSSGAKTGVPVIPKAAIDDGLWDPRSIPNPWEQPPAPQATVGADPMSSTDLRDAAEPSFRDPTPYRTGDAQPSTGLPDTVRIPPETPYGIRPPETNPLEPAPRADARDDRGGRFRTPDISIYSDGNRSTGEPSLANPRGESFGARITSPSVDPPAARQESLPLRPGFDRSDPSNRFESPPPLPDTTNRFDASIGDERDRIPYSGTTGDASAATPTATFPKFDTRSRERFTPSNRDPLTVEPNTLSTPQSLKKASFDEPTLNEAGAPVQMEKPSLPESAAQPPYKPWGWLVVALLALFASASANLYLGWIAVDLHRRYRSAVMQLTDAAAIGV